MKFINICCVHVVGKPLEIVSLVNVLYSSKSPERKKRIKFRVYKRLFIKYLKSFKKDRNTVYTVLALFFKKRPQPTATQPITSSLYEIAWAHQKILISFELSEFVKVNG